MVTIFPDFELLIGTKKIFRLLPVLAVALSLTACETYKVDDPDMTAVSGFDGMWYCFAYDPADLDNPVTVFDVQITNTTFNEADRFWMTVTDVNYPETSGDPYYLDAVRFDVSCDADALTFSCSEVECEYPRTCHNLLFGQGYDSYGYYAGLTSSETVSITDGRVTLDGVDTHSGYKADAIEFTYTRTTDDGSGSPATVTYYVRGMKNTGWEEDMADYTDFIDNVLLQ